jgi:hypothetical protein
MVNKSHAGSESCCRTNSLHQFLSLDATTLQYNNLERPRICLCARARRRTKDQPRARHTGGFATLCKPAPTDCSRSRPKQTSAARKFPLNSQSKQHARAHIYKQQNQACPTYLCILNFEGAAARVDVGAVQCVLGSFR